MGAWRYLGVSPKFFHLHKHPPGPSSAQAHTVGPAALNSAPKQANKLPLKSVSPIRCPCSEGMINPVSETELSHWEREVEEILAAYTAHDSDGGNIVKWSQGAVRQMRDIQVYT